MAKKIEVAEETLPYLTPSGALTELAKKRLANPFDPESVYWKPTNVKSGKCTALAYGDKRAYEERLDEVFGPENWGDELTTIQTSPYHIVKKAKHKIWNDPTSEITEPEQIIDGFRVMAVMRINVRGLLSKESSGVSETEDENSITTAEAQAFKRACSLLGIGKYLYSLPRYNDVEIAYGKIKNPPKLPDWALPTSYCSDCTIQIKTTEFKTKDDTVQSWNPTEIIKRSQAHFGTDLCMDCMRKRKVKVTPASVDSRLGPQGEPAAAEPVAA